jgi:oxalate decarboxylase/phosphoglucose isomerase-like protein (cupin superfamily)
MKRGKVPEGLPHGITNTGSVDLGFLVIYDPPDVLGTDPVINLED